MVGIINPDESTKTLVFKRTDTVVILDGSWETAVRCKVGCQCPFIVVHDGRGVYVPGGIMLSPPIEEMIGDLEADGFKLVRTKYGCFYIVNAFEYAGTHEIKIDWEDTVDWQRIDIGYPNDSSETNKFVADITTFLQRGHLDIAKQYQKQAVSSYKYRPLPKKVRNEYLSAYLLGLNGFNQILPRAAVIDGMCIAKGYERIVVGDYGAYVEIKPEDLIVSLNVKEGQEWRLDREYLVNHKLENSVKYVWYTYTSPSHPHEIKVYYQLNPVKYADYKHGFYYISVLDFDPI